MRKIFLITFLLGGFCLSSNAQQLTERVDDVAIYKIGNRPGKGTKVLTFGMGLNDTEGKLFSKYNLLQKGNLLTGKYFISDNVAIRAGIRLSKETNTSGGDIDTSITGGTTISNSLQQTTRNYAIMPGIERHFSYSNFFDVYTGGDLYLGFEKDKLREEYDYTNGFYNRKNSKTNTTKVGVGGVVGVNIFILDLPISIGIEYGISGIWNLGGKTHVKEEVSDPLGQRTNDYYTQGTDAFNNPDANKYSKLKKNSSEIQTNNNLKILLNIYFK
jgi:hypothetical protein